MGKWIRGQAFLGISINLKSEIGVMTRSQDLLKPRSVSVLGVFDIRFSSSSREICRFNAAQRPQLWQPFLDLVNTLQAGFESMQTDSCLN